MDKITNAVASLKALATPDHKYRAIPVPVTDRNHSQSEFDEHPPRSKFSKLSITIMLLAASLFLAFFFGQDRSDNPSCVNSASCRYDPQKQWGQYSPYFSAPHGSIKPDVPSGCEVNFVSVLSRHGSRFPTAGKSKTYKELIARIQKDVKDYSNGFEFFKHYNYSLGSDSLTTSGENELFKSGKTFFERYEKLAKDSTNPFFRASGSDRVVMSAERFLQGFYHAKGQDGDKNLTDILVIPEGDAVNNTLDHGICKAFEDGPDSKLGDEKTEVWADIWAPPVMKRLNEKLPGANLTLDETVYLMDMCPFDTASSNMNKLSQFCQLFSKGEWESYDYFQSLSKWYGYGPANPLGPTQGVGYVNELIARLTKVPVKDDTTTNATLDTHPDTFPLDRLLYADFSHDNTLMPVYGALGLYSNDTELPTNRIVSAEHADGYSAAWTVPFGARVYVEKMVCKKDDHELVRVLVNDRVVSPKGCKADELGRCKVDDFLNGLAFAKKGGLWNQC